MAQQTYGEWMRSNPPIPTLTAVEWLKDKLKETYDKEGKLPLAYTLHLVEQAKQMEKEQMINAHTNGQAEYDTEAFRPKVKELAEQYYNETYGK